MLNSNNNKVFVEHVHHYVLTPGMENDNLVPHVSPRVSQMLIEPQENSHFVLYITP